MCRFGELRCKEVVNLRDGARLGYVDDMEFSVPEGRVISVVIYGKAHFFGLFGRDDDIVICWEDIQKIGADTVLVNHDASSRASQPRKGGFFASLFK